RPGGAYSTGVSSDAASLLSSSDDSAPEGGLRYLQTDLAPEDPGKQATLLLEGPLLEKELAPPLDVDHHLVGVEAHGDALHPLQMLPVEGVGEPENAGQPPHPETVAFPESPVEEVLLPGLGPSMIPRHEGDEFQVAGRNVGDFGVVDEVERVLVVPAVRD